MTTLADVVDALQRANCQPTRTGNDAYTAHCPVHEADGHGHKPSLSVARGDTQPVVVHCHAGCSHAAIMAALGIQSTSKDSTARRSSGAGSRRIVAVYPYHDASGTLLFEFQSAPANYGGRIRHVAPMLAITSPVSIRARQLRRANPVLSQLID